MTIWIFISFVISSFVIVSTLPLNAAVLYAIINNSSFHSKFHAILFNISLSDLLTALVLCPTSLYINIQKLRGFGIQSNTDLFFRYSIVLLSKVYLITMILLAADRVVSLRHPKYYRKLRIFYVVVAVVLSWIISFLTSIYFFYSDFSKYLSITFICFVSPTVVINLIVVSYFQLHLRNSRKNSIRLLLQKEHSAGQSGLKPQYNPDLTFYKMEKRAAGTYWYITLSFIIVYMPILGTCGYLHTRKHDSIEAQKAQKVIYILVMTSCIIKIFSFLTRLTALRKACINQFQSHRAIEKKWREESLCHPKPMQDIDNQVEELSV
ncbi:uncharacterized protein LOC136085916 isoform X1 [Hydra vulgaris]|uniref:uncharacterized protein LOC136085916 isoform X1 n=1 Tax=Hydra vulgaris TaxID=6087 RepID=UPI0032EA2FD8